MMTFTDVLDQAMRLTAKERAELAWQLWETVEDASRSSDELDEQWLAKIEARCQEVDEGRAVMFEWRESVERIRQSLAARRAGRGAAAS